jgi:cytochrome P450
MTGPPLSLLEEHQRRFGDSFRLELLGPPYRRDRTRRPVVRRRVIVFSAPAEIREVFARSDELRAGEAQEFFEWFLGPRSVMVQDGPAHTEEKRRLQSVLSPDRQEALEPVLTEAARRAVAEWRPGGPQDLRPLLESAFDAMSAAAVFGAMRLDRGLERYVARARRIFATPYLSVPMLRVRIGRLGPGALPGELRRELARLLDRPRNQPPALFDLLRDLSPGADADRALFLDRLITTLSGMDATTPAALWTAWHLLRSHEARMRVSEEAAALALPGPDSYLDAACREVLRLHPVFPAVGRRVATPTMVGGYQLAEDTYVMVSMYLLHRRPELFPDPEAFRPERFLTDPPRSTAYAPFGVGTRHCLGAAFAPRQLRALFGALFRHWDPVPEGMPAEGARRRGVAVAPAARLMVRLRPR